MHLSIAGVLRACVEYSKDSRQEPIVVDDKLCLSLRNKSKWAHHDLMRTAMLPSAQAHGNMMCHALKWQQMRYKTPQVGKTLSSCQTRSISMNEKNKNFKTTNQNFLVFAERQPETAHSICTMQLLHRRFIMPSLTSNAINAAPRKAETIDAISTLTNVEIRAHRQAAQHENSTMTRPKEPSSARQHIPRSGSRHHDGRLPFVHK